MRRGQKMQITATCEACGTTTPVFYGYLSRLVLKSHIERLLAAENHTCKEPK